MKKTGIKVLSSIFALSFTIACGACGGTGLDSSSKDRTVIKFWPASNQYTAESISQIVKEYNEGQGVKDGVFVQADLTKVDISSNHFSVCPENVRNQTDILTVTDRTIFYGAGYASGSFYADLSELAAKEELRTKDENGNYYLSFEDYIPSAINRYYFNRETREAGNPQSGSLYALPFGSNPSVLMYNETYFENANINIISIKEDLIEQERLFGLRAHGNIRANTTHIGNFSFGELKYRVNQELLLESVGAEVLAKNEEGNIVFSRHKFGKGLVYFLNFPMEYNLFSEKNAFTDTDWYKIYRIAASEVLKNRLFVSNNPQICTTLHKVTDKNYIVCAINYSDRLQKTEFVIKDGWTIKTIDGEKEEIGKCDGAFYELVEKSEE